MANTIASVKAYVNNQVEHLNMFKRNLLCADLMVKNPEIKGKTISYDRYSFANYVMGNYNRDNGTSQKDLTIERVDKVLTQDRGDTLSLDIGDKNDGQVADGLIGIYNFYQVKVEVPTIDSYAFGQIAGQGSDAKVVVSGQLTKDNIVDAICDTEKELKNKRIKLDECLFYISVSANTLLAKSAFKNAHISMGNWNGKLDTQVEMFDKMKLIEVPDATLGCAFVITHPMSASVIDVLGIVNAFDKVPGKPGKAQVDVRDYFDAWVEPSGAEGIALCVEAPRDLKLTKNADNSVTITGVENGAKVYWKGSSGATASDTEVTKGADGSYKIATPAQTTHFYVKQFIGTTGSKEADIAVTIS